LELFVGNLRRLFLVENEGENDLKGSEEGADEAKIIKTYRRRAGRRLPTV
jgi:hypothetical protein